MTGGGGVLRLGNRRNKFDNHKGQLEHIYASEGGDGKTIFVFRAHFVLISHTKNSHHIHITLVERKDNMLYPNQTFHVK